MSFGKTSTFIPFMRNYEETISCGHKKPSHAGCAAICWITSHSMSLESMDVVKCMQIAFLSFINRVTDPANKKKTEIGGGQNHIPLSCHTYKYYLNGVNIVHELLQQQILWGRSPELKAPELASKTPYIICDTMHTP
ncbi:3177_t:CDS:2, partial [Acaulospora morrowiae]